MTTAFRSVEEITPDNLSNRLGYPIRREALDQRLAVHRYFPHHEHAMGIMNFDRQRIEDLIRIHQDEIDGQALLHRKDLKALENRMALANLNEVSGEKLDSFQTQNQLLRETMSLQKRVAQLKELIAKQMVQLGRRGRLR